MLMQFSCGCCASPAAPANFPVYRYMALVGPIAPELGTENKAWTFPMIQTSTATGFSHEALWHSTDTVTSVDPRNGDRRWVYRMHPVRFRIEGYQSAFRDTIITQRFSAPLFPITGLSSVLPTTASHVGLGITSARISNAGFNYNGFTSNGGLAEGATTHYRIWLDGVDKTGIVALTSPFGHGQFTNTGNPRRIGGLMPTQSSLNFAGAAGKTVWVDLWIQITVLNNLAFTQYPNGFGGVQRAVMCNLDPVCSFNNSEFLNGNVNAKREDGDQYKFIFSNAGPGGLSAITPSTSGWTMTSLASSQNHRNNSVGFLDFKWFTESPHIDLTINSQNNVPSGGGAIMRYMPVDTGHYQLTLRSGNRMRPGVWNPQGVTVFQQVARQYLNGFYVKGSRELPSNFYTSFPDTITVEKA
jgi:hypothetical protein